MKTKLTLSIDPDVIARAKEEAQRRGTSVSDMVETYLAVVSKPNETQKTFDRLPFNADANWVFHFAETCR